MGNLEVTGDPRASGFEWTKDRRGYCVVESTGELERLAASWRDAEPGGWPPHWPQLSEQWLGNVLEDARRLGSHGIFPGKGIVWPRSSHPVTVDPLQDGITLAERFLNSGHHVRRSRLLDAVNTLRDETPDGGDGDAFRKAADYLENLGDSARTEQSTSSGGRDRFLYGSPMPGPSDHEDVVTFTDRYGLLWHDEPMTVQGFRAARDSVAELAGVLRAGRTADAQSEIMLTFQVGPGLAASRLIDAIALAVFNAKNDWGLLWKVCQNDECGLIFSAGKGGARSHKAAKCCSPECSERYHNSVQNRKKAKRRHEGESAAPVIADQPCPYCGGPIHLTSRKRTTEHCGSDRCKNMHSRAKRKARTARTEGGK